MNLNEAKGDWALVTGASSGIGREFCCKLADKGMKLVLVARRSDLLNELASEIEQDFGVETLVVSIDLSEPQSASELARQVKAEGIRIRMLCNIAAAGRWGRFENTETEAYERIVQLNTASPASLCREMLDDLSSHPSSAIINASSQAALQPVPYMAVYAATKAFIHSFSQALYWEWKDKGVLVQTLVPGPTATEFDAKAGAYESAVQERGAPADVVEAAFQHLEKGSPIAFHAKGTYLQRFFAGLFPSRMVLKEVSKMFQPPS